ncbi:MAG: solute:Na+ symporter, family [Candidatus Sumerlaeota bacterium]|nr:solute:Na+ symporter, family [Candidatus Sumerlaeota bacterium]
MEFIDYAIFGIYMAVVLGIGFYFFLKNESGEDYYVGGRSIPAHHVGVSIVATDVGGGFSIGLGGVGFVMGLAGSWLLFTGLVGAWLSAVFLIPRIKAIDTEHKMMTYPDFLRWRYDGKVALVAAMISGIGYLGFTGGQIRAGATLAANTVITKAPFGMDPMQFALWVIAIVTILYTASGGLKAVIYTDSVQWIILLGGLIFVAIPLTLIELGGWSAITAQLPDEFFSLFNIEPMTFINWMITIIPIWLIGMTLYQRMFACRDEKEAKKAWYIAGFFEYPIMAFTGVILGMCSRVAFPELPDSAAEQGLPMLIRDILPVGVAGIVIAAYFSAIMSTADSCMMASSGNFTNDVIERYFMKGASHKKVVLVSMIVTLVIGVTAVLLASVASTVLDAIMLAYAFMVSGLFVPTLGAYFWKRASSAGAFWGMLSGGVVALVLIVLGMMDRTPGFVEALGLDATFYGIVVSAVVFVSLSLGMPDREAEPQPSA